MRYATLKIALPNVGAFCFVFTFSESLRLLREMHTAAEELRKLVQAPVLLNTSNWIRDINNMVDLCSPVMIRNYHNHVEIQNTNVN